MPEENNTQNTMKELYPFKEAEQYVNLLQENITRMANNSANCKNWLVAIIVGALAITDTINSFISLPNMLYMLKCITGVFFFLDCLYLGMERDFITVEKSFIKACKANNPNVDDIKMYWMSFSKTISIDDKTPDECCIKFRQLWKQLKGAFCALFSWSTTPFYVTIFGVLFHIG